MGPKSDDDKFSAIWLSHSSISDFLKCPKLYYYANVYKNPLSGRKITIMKPSLALGQVVHKVIESLSELPANERLAKPLLDRFEETWPEVSGKKGGFVSSAQEEQYKEKGRHMLKQLQENPGPLQQKTVKLKQEIPNFWLSESDNIILCGKIDWIEYVEEVDGVHVIDFKTGARREKADSLQLPIYVLLLKNVQTRDIVRMSYWYLQTDKEPTEVPLPDVEDAREQFMKIALRVKLARQLNHYGCAVDDKNGCRECAQYEAVIKGKGEFVGVGEYNKEVYILPEESVSL